jgi:YebC/PmpR family DNA-binding regulatory protein
MPMSGHNKWSSIKHKKGAADAKRGKIFSRIGKEITLAAKQGGKDIDMNPRLRTAVATGKAANMPNENIERAIKKGCGELQGTVIEEIMYEGYAPGGVGILVSVLTDNRNRTASNIRNLFEKNNGRLASSGAVARQFHRKARFMVSGPGLTEDKLLELLLDAGCDVENVVMADGEAEILAAHDAFAQVAKTLEKAGIEVSESTIAMMPETLTEARDESLARQATRLIDALEEDDDVQAVYSNLSISDEIMAKLAAAQN